MKILKLESENIKRLQAIEITPQGNVVTIGGDNGQGKTSVLDSIAYALGGKRAVCDKPVRAGQEYAKIICELDDLTVTRTFTPSGGGSLTVANKDGARYGSPQAMLDKLTGALTFDPLHFIRMDTKPQLETLKNLVGLDFTEQDQKRQILYDERTHVNRDIKKLKANLDTMPTYADAPDVEVSVSALMAELNKRQTQNRQNQQAERELGLLEDRIDKGKEIVSDLQRKIKELQEQLSRSESKLKDLQKEHTNMSQEVAKLVNNDEQDIMDKIAGAENINSQIQNNRQKSTIAKELKALEQKANTLTEQIQAVDDGKSEALSKASFPVPGMSFDETGVSLNSIPFSQASGAEQLRVSVAMGFAMNPKLKVLLVRDGSLLDKDNLKLLAELAEAHDGQVWLERVGDGDECAVIIEDGKVRT